MPDAIQPPNSTGTEENEASGILGDRALEQGGEDRLGFRKIAARIATALVDHTSDGGLVVGIDGAWGTGKSSLLFLIEDELGKFDVRQRPTIINFRPWLVGQRDALLASLFGTLGTQINKVAADAGNATGVSVEKAKAVAEALRNFTKGLGQFGSIVEFTGDATGFAPLKWTGKGLNALRDSIKKKAADKPLPELKSNLIRSLKELGHRFIVTIDDVDRLEPSEVIELLRLVRSVADFPNVIYLLCYDSEILAHSIEEAARVKSGQAYLEKIVQLPIMVPSPEAFELRQWFTDDLRKIATTNDQEQLSRLRSVISYEGGRLLTTPRAVVRALDSIRFFWPPLQRDGADLSDLVWLQLIKNGNPALYRWIEHYCVEAAVLSLGTGTISDEEKKRLLADLSQVDEGSWFADSLYRYHFAEHLPGLEVGLIDDGSFELFQKEDREIKDANIRNRRLASPDHYRLYFALAAPAHTVTGFNTDEIAEAAELDSATIGKILIELHKNNMGTSEMGQADLLLERFTDGRESLSQNQSKHLLLAFSSIMDEAYRTRNFDRQWTYSLWDRAERLVPLLLSKFDSVQRADVIHEMFLQGEAIGWLTKIFRRETFAHGRFGDRPRPQQDWILQADELDKVTAIMLERYQALTMTEFFNSVEALDLLFAWAQAGNPEAPKGFVASCIAEDEGLVRTLEKLQTFVTSSERGTYPVLSRRNVEPFLDFDAARARTTALAAGNSPLAKRAKALTNAFQKTDDDWLS